MRKTKHAPRKTLPADIGKVLKRLHYPLDVIVLCVRWYVAYSLSLRNREEMMVERGIEVDHSSVHRWVIKLVPLFERRFDGTSDRLARAGGWTKPTSRSKANGSTCTAPSTSRATRLNSCCAPIVTRLLFPAS